MLFQGRWWTFGDRFFGVLNIVLPREGRMIRPIDQSSAFFVFSTADRYNLMGLSSQGFVFAAVRAYADPELSAFTALYRRRPTLKAEAPTNCDAANFAASVTG